jgi:hypothetical protein
MANSSLLSFEAIGNLLFHVVTRKAPTQVVSRAPALHITATFPAVSKYPPAGRGRGKGSGAA